MRLHPLPILLFVTHLILATSLFASPSKSASQPIKSTGQEDLFSLYQYFHANPELSFEEEQTASRIATELKQLGFKVTENIGGHGLVGILRNGEGPTVMIRADMDALPIKEQTGLPYASRVTTTREDGSEVPVAHACGHDIHMTVLIGTARKMVKNRDHWAGTLMLVAQPAEERGAGSRLMLADGLFDRFPRPDFNLALHTSAELPAGQLGFTRGYAMANVDSVDIDVRGVGGHGAYPHKTKDPVVIAAAIIMRLQTIVSREISPLESAVITVGSIHGGTKHNVIGNSVKLQLTVRSYSDETRNYLLDRIKEISEGEARTAGLDENLLPIVKVKDEYTPSVLNNPELTDRVVSLLAEKLGKASVRNVPPVMAGEDFARYGRAEPPIPSLLFWLGSVDPKVFTKATKAGQGLPSLHSPKFAPAAKPTIATGVNAMSTIALELMNRRQIPQEQAKK